MALEVIREIVGFGEGLVGRLVMLDARAMRFETLRYAWDPANPLSGEHPTIHDLSALSPKHPSPALPVIDAVRPHIGGGCHAIRHVEEAGDGGNVPNIAIAKPARRTRSRSSSSTSHGSAVSLTAKSSMARWRFDKRAAR